MTRIEQILSTLRKFPKINDAWSNVPFGVRIPEIMGMRGEHYDYINPAAAELILTVSDDMEWLLDEQHRLEKQVLADDYAISEANREIEALKNRLDWVEHKLEETKAALDVYQRTPQRVSSDKKPKRN
jgi:tetrahydromethanopterin S-methyltransferase subunit G